MENESIKNSDIEHSTTETDTVDEPLKSKLKACWNILKPKKKSKDKNEDKMTVNEKCFMACILFEGAIMLTFGGFVLLQHNRHNSNYTCIPNEVIEDIILRETEQVSDDNESELQEDNANDDSVTDDGECEDDSDDSINESSNLWDKIVIGRRDNKPHDKVDDSTLDLLYGDGFSSIPIYERDDTGYYSVKMCKEIVDKSFADSYSSLLLNREVSSDDADAMLNCICEWMKTLCISVNTGCNDAYIGHPNLTSTQLMLNLIAGLQKFYPGNITDYVERYFLNVNTGLAQTINPVLKMNIDTEDKVSSIFIKKYNYGYSYCQFRVTNVVSYSNLMSNVNITDLKGDVFNDTHFDIDSLYEIELSHYSKYYHETYRSYVYIAETIVGGSKWFYVVDFVPANLYYISESDYDKVLDFSKFDDSTILN